MKKQIKTIMLLLTEEELMMVNNAIVEDRSICKTLSKGASRSDVLYLNKQIKMGFKVCKRIEKILRRIS